MSKIIKQTNDITVTDITEEAKEILKPAMKNFVGEKYEKQAYLRDRRWYWQDLGLTEIEATEKAINDYEWVYGEKPEL